MNKKAASGKAPMSSLNDIINAQIAKVPRVLLMKMLRKKFQEIGRNVHDPMLEALADHILDNGDDSFTWDDGQEGAVEALNLSFTEQDIQSVVDDSHAFMQDILPDLLHDSAVKTGKSILRSLKADWPVQKAYDTLRINQFRDGLEERWSDSFDLLRMIYTIAIELGQETATRWRRSRNQKRVAQRTVILQLHARACQVTAEIICLMENGYADGAMARWRTLHEIVVVASLIDEHGNDLAERYLDHEAVEAKRAMDRYLVTYAALGYESPDPQDVEDTEREYQSCLTEYGDNFGSQYGWAAYHLNLKKPRFDDLEAAAGKVAMRSHYVMASYNVHATAKGIAFRLGLMGDGEVNALAGASNAGFVEPGQNTAHEIVQITGLLFGSPWRFDRLVEMRVLLELRNQVPAAFMKAARRLEKDHKAEQRARPRRAHKRKAS